jgi:hypothetical protein
VAGAVAGGRSVRFDARTATLLSGPARSGRVARCHDGTSWAACCASSSQAARAWLGSTACPSVASSSRSRAWTSLGTATVPSGNGQGSATGRSSIVCPAESGAACRP